MRVGFIGLGNMGGPLARRLAGRVDLTVHDRDAATFEAFTDTGARRCDDLDELADGRDIVLTCLPTSAHVRAVLLGEDGLVSRLAPGTIVADMTTGDPSATRAMAAEIEGLGVHLIDAPVSGGPRGAREGTIAIIVGASPELFARARPTFDVISSNVLHAGDVGCGHALKAGNNLLNLVCRLATFEVVSALVNDGVDPARAVEIIQKSSGRSYATEVTLPDNILSGTMRQGFTVGLMHKDSGLGLDIARAHDCPAPLGELARSVLEETLDEHGPDADMSAVALTFERLTGARIRPPD